LKRRNYSPHIDCMLEKRLAPQTINGHLIVIRGFYNYLKDEEERRLDNPAVMGMALRLPKPLPRHLRDGDVEIFFEVVKKRRDAAM